VSGEAFADHPALSFRDRQPVLIGNDSIPEGANVPNLVFRRELIETRGRNWKSVCHVERIASDGGLDNRTKTTVLSSSAQRTAVKLRPYQGKQRLRWRRPAPVVFTRARGTTLQAARRRGRLLQQLVGRRAVQREDVSIHRRFDAMPRRISEPSSHQSASCCDDEGLHDVTPTRIQGPTKVQERRDASNHKGERELEPTPQRGRPILSRTF
jgi:hypothetical protein